MKTMRGALAPHASTSDLLREMVASNLAGEAVGIYSVCSADRLVIEAGMTQAERDDTVSLVESTCNQVNQSGGYTGMTPADFRDYAYDIAASVGLPRERVVLGGDHLGPFPWQGEPAAAAMAKARDLVHACAAAGYTKIHLDASMRCADDPEGPLDDAVATAREVELCGVAEQAAREAPPGTPAPVYVIGTEVPVPGGEQESQPGVPATPVARVAATLALAEETFTEAGLRDAWERVIALVVQPGVEFGDAVVFDYERDKVRDLSSFIERHGTDQTPPRGRLAFEAHSTDYQTPRALRELVEDHFVILKVGPGLTFALREALFALEAIERELSAGAGAVAPSGVRATLERVMLAHPEHWRAYYHGDDEALRLARAFSFSDRARYYWSRPELEQAVGRLLANVGARELPLALVSQYFPGEYRAVREGRLAPRGRDLLRHHILTVVEAYASACGM